VLTKISNSKSQKLEPKQITQNSIFVAKRLPFAKEQQHLLLNNKIITHQKRSDERKSFFVKSTRLHSAIIRASVPENTR
jgi:dihydropteroate synthase